MYEANTSRREETGSSPVIVGGFSIPLPVMGRATRKSVRQRISKDRETGTTSGQWGLTDPATQQQQNTHSSQAHGILSPKDCMSGHRKSPNKF